VQKAIMKNRSRLIRAILTCAALSAALMSANAWADLTAQQAHALQTKAGAGDKAALQTLTSAAQQGNPYAQFDLSGLYFRGQGVAKDYTQAAQWSRKAADQGLAIAQLFLGTLYEDGQGVPQDYGLAVQWHRKAADQGLALAQRELGSFYVSGHGVPQDYGQAAQWFRKAADQGDAKAQLFLALLYEHGQGVSQDYAQAAQWYRKAAQQGNADAQRGLGFLYATGQGVPQNLVVTYALFNLPSAQDSSDNDSISQERDSLAAHMTKQEIEAGQSLSQEMSRPGNLLKALDQYLATPGDTSH
jgi:TPR repeat protein